jgi:hypothetical protein
MPAEARDGRTGDGALRVPHDNSDSWPAERENGGFGADPVSQTTEPLCRRCRRPTGRSARNAIFCIDCACEQHQERRRASHAKGRGGSWEQWQTVLAAWRDGTLRRVLEAVE